MKRSFFTSLPLMRAGALLVCPPALYAVTLEVTAWKGNDSEPAAIPDLIKKFEAANPDISIDFSYISRTDTDIVLPPRVQGDNPPDVMMTDMPLVKVWEDAGLLAPIDKGDWFARLTPAVQKAINTGCFDPATQAGLDPWSTALSEFKAGNFAMMAQCAWNIASFSEAEDLDFVFAPIPSTKDSGVALDLFGIGWSIAAKSDQPEAAKNFCRLFFEQQQSA